MFEAAMTQSPKNQENRAVDATVVVRAADLAEVVAVEEEAAAVVAGVAVELVVEEPDAVVALPNYEYFDIQFGSAVRLAQVFSIFIHAVVLKSFWP
jgi:hypothetical protein